MEMIRGSRESFLLVPLAEYTFIFLFGESRDRKGLMCLEFVSH